VTAADETLQQLAATVLARDPGATITMLDHADATLASRPRPAITIPTLPQLEIAIDEAGPAHADFAVGGVLGEGGMGRVLLARQKSLHRDVAVKVLKAEAARREIIEALLAEAVVTGSLEHPNVVPVHALGLDAQGRPVLVMKRIEGVAWRDLVRDERHPAWASVAASGDRLDAHLEILMAVCNAVHFAHSRGIVHRDLKLDNVMIGSFGEVYVVDWGIAIRLRSNDRSFGLVGTPAYMAPEMVMGGAIDERTDVYLLGATLHAALTGASRHAGESMYDVLLSARDSAPFAYGPEIPAELAAILNKAMRAAPAERFPSALELRRAVAAFRGHRGSIALSDEAAARLAEVDRENDEERHARLTECRFGFTAALRAWPENEAARRGLAECLARMIEHELAQRDLAGARALFAELREPRPDLLARIDALAAEIAAAEEREKKLRALERDRDLSIGGGAQIGVVAVLPVIAVGIVAYITWRGFQTPGAAELIIIPLVSCAVLLVRYLRARRELTTEISRKSLGMLPLITGAVTLHRIYQTHLGASVASIFIGDLMIAGALCAAMGFAISPRFAWLIVPATLGAAAIMARPAWALPLFAATTVVSFVIVLILWKRLVKA
jgi:serine/threonine-protein kinase